MLFAARLGQAEGARHELSEGLLGTEAGSYYNLLNRQSLFDA